MSKSSEFGQLLQPKVQRYIREHDDSDESLLVLKNKEIFGVSSALIAQQIVGRRKAKEKLSLFYNTPDIVYPPKLNLEQCSSENAARFKSEIHSGKIALDLTGGMGVDSLFLSKNFEKVYYVEKDEALLTITKHNHEVLRATNIEHWHCDAESYLQSNNEFFDLVYVDPSRRSASNKKVFKFSECSPNVIALLPTLQKFSKTILIKASPMIDIKQGVKELGNVSKVFVVGYNNECKEILFLIEKITGTPSVEAIDLSADGLVGQKFAFNFIDEIQTKISYGEPKKYLYEPNAMILKAGAFKLIANRFDLKKIAPNTHLYTSNKLHLDFPGRIFNIECHLKSDAKSIGKMLPDGYANVTTRNYPVIPAQLKKKLKLKDGGDQFVIGFSGTQKKYLVLASRLN